MKEQVFSKRAPIIIREWIGFLKLQKERSLRLGSQIISNLQIYKMKLNHCSMVDIDRIQ
jgi:hypothetical protein